MPDLSEVEPARHGDNVLMIACPYEDVWVQLSKHELAQHGNGLSEALRF
jgi:hypothetical protein